MNRILRGKDDGGIIVRDRIIIINQRLTTALW